jgi:type I restriction enzyme, S subunit
VSTSSLPATWSRVKLGDIGEALIGLTYDPQSIKRDGTLVLRSSNIQDGRLTFDDNVYVDCAVPKRIRIRDQDILICVRNGSRRLIGKSTMLDRRVVGNTFGAFMCVFRSDVNPYLRYFFQSDDFKRQIDEHLGATINQITNGSLNSFSVVLPTEAEQAAIIRRLNDADDLIATLERLIVKKQVIKQGMMAQLLTGKTRLPGFTDPWRSQRLGESLSFQVGYPFSSSGFSKVANGLRLVRNRDLKSDDSIIYYVNEYQGSFVVQDKDVLIGMDGDFSPCIWSGGRALLNQRVGRLSCTSSDAIFMYYALQGPLKALESGTGATTVKHLSHHEVESIVMKAPGFAEQRAIAEVLGDVDNELDCLRSRLKKAIVIKQGMVQELLTGRTRLSVAEAVS